MTEDASAWVTTTTILRDLRDPGNGRAWGRFVERFREPLEAFGRTCGLGGADAEDLVQEALLEFSNLLREGRYERDRGRLSAYLFGVAYRCALRLKQKRARDRMRTGQDDDPGGPWAALSDEKNADQVWNREWERWVWCRCIERARVEFEPVTLRAFVLSAEGERSAEDVAAELGIPMKAVYNAKHRVLKRLRELREELEATG